MNKLDELIDTLEGDANYFELCEADLERSNEYRAIIKLLRAAKKMRDDDVGYFQRKQNWVSEAAEAWDAVLDGGEG